MRHHDVQRARPSSAPSSTVTTGTGHSGPSSAASMTDAAPAAPGRRTSTSARGRCPRRPATRASWAACAVERTWAPAVAADRSTPPVSSAASARASPRRVSSSTPGSPRGVHRRVASSSSSTGMPSTTGKPRPHDVQVSTSASGSVGVPARSGAWSSDGQARISISCGSSCDGHGVLLRDGCDTGGPGRCPMLPPGTVGRATPDRRCGGRVHGGTCELRPCGAARAHRRRGRSPAPRRAARPSLGVRRLDVEPQQRLGVAARRLNHAPSGSATVSPSSSSIVDAVRAAVALRICGELGRRRRRPSS